LAVGNGRLAKMRVAGNKFKMMTGGFLELAAYKKAFDLAISKLPTANCQLPTAHCQQLAGV